MLTVRKVVTKLRLVMYDHILKNTVFGYNKRTKSSIDTEFKTGKWNFLESSEEKARYDNIIELYKEFKPKGSIFDVGCAQGVLFKYLRESFPNITSLYCGIDISEKAIESAKKKFPTADFRVMNVEKEKLEGKFDVIIFNETLYYFSWPLKVLEKYIKENLSPGGIIIVSMYEYQGRNKRIWKHIDQAYKILGAKTATNKNGHSWDAKAFKPG